MKAPMLLLAALFAATPLVRAQSTENVLLRRAADNTFVPVVIGVPQPHEVVAGGGYQLAYPAGVLDAEAADATFATDADGVVELDEGKRVLFIPPSVARIDLPGGGKCLELWVPSRTTGEAPRKHRFDESGVVVRPAPPGWVLLDLERADVDPGLRLPLVIETPLPLAERPSEPGTLLQLVDDQLRRSSTVRERATLLENPDTANKLVQGLIGRDSGRSILKDVNLAVKMFDDENGQSALGFSYDYAKTWGKDPDSDSTTVDGFEFEFAARGNVVFDSRFNPTDFLDSKFKYRYYRSSGGVRDDLPPPTEAEKRARLDRITELTKLGDDYQSSKLHAEHSRDIRRAMTPQVHFDVGVSGGLESNQDFTARNYTYGLEALLDVKVWDPDDAWSDCNLLDIPFAAVRVLTGYDEDFTIRGSALPTLLVAIDQVEPDGGNPRAMFGDDSSFARVRGEVSFRTPVAWIEDGQTWFNANYRIYHELGASQAIEDAGLETFHFLALSLTTDAGFLVTYTRGQLPFDVNDGESVQVGWAFNL